ncbi:uncharacterized protein EAE97_001374 [Botrytis byssoidea]|uniref:Uncharacterized protein n=1 Tax=Botrytis byssoidea TaxID=139641 RepID=A0A9P5LZ30_9HELO|nr:uncharacterized protein EAE97_001374 [Botrytis byssoidea]KAF7953976.1 hypothetical protein EAE97_001374 [Botrytis byssoidea]
MCRSITFRYSICTHSWRPYVIPCSNPIKDTSTDIDSTNICPAYRTKYERRVIKSGNGFCAACWEKKEKREKSLRERERILEGKMKEGVVGKGERRLGRRFWEKNGEGRGGGKEKEDARVLEDISEEPGVVLEERVGNLRRDDEESEKLLQETENKTWTLEGNGGVRKKLDGNERNRIRNGWLGLETGGSYSLFS